MRLYYSLAWNKTPFEIIMVGPNKPNFKLPVNFQHIETNVKAVQCNYIAALNAKGKYFLTSGDDITYSQYSLDNLLQCYESEKQDLCFVTPLGDWIIMNPRNGLIMQKRIGKAFHTSFFGRRGEKYRLQNKFCPVIPHQGLFLTKKTYFDIGGPDMRFITSFWDHDIAMRIYEAGGYGFCCRDAVMIDASFGESDSIGPPEIRKTDKQLLYSLWCKSDQKEARYSLDNLANIKTIDREAKDCKVSVLKKRSDPPLLFQHEHLLTKSQGETATR